MSNFEKMSLDDKIEYRLAEKEAEQLRVSNSDLIKRRQSLEVQIELNSKKIEATTERRLTIAEKYKWAT